MYTFYSKCIRKLIDRFDKTLFCAISVPKRRLAVVDGFKVVRSEIPNTLFTTHNKLIAWAKISEIAFSYNLIEDIGSVFSLSTLIL